MLRWRASGEECWLTTLREDVYEMKKGPDTGPSRKLQLHMRLAISRTPYDYIDIYI